MDNQLTGSEYELYVLCEKIEKDILFDPTFDDDLYNISVLFDPQTT